MVRSYVVIELVKGATVEVRGEYTFARIIEYQLQRVLPPSDERQPCLTPFDSDDCTSQAEHRARTARDRRSYKTLRL